MICAAPKLKERGATKRWGSFDRLCSRWLTSQWPLLIILYGSQPDLTQECYRWIWPQSAGCFPSSIATAFSCSGSVTPCDASLNIRSAIFAFVAGVRLATSICSTAASRTDRIVQTSSEPNLFVNFGYDNEFDIRTLPFAVSSNGIVSP
jgi:hypothetical protein